MEVKGVYTENFKTVEMDGDEDSSSHWEQDGNIQAKFIVDKGTAFTVRGDFRDGTWGTDEMKAKSNYSDGEQGFTIQRAFLEHDFGKAAIHAGLMATGGWGTAFGNNVEGNYRVKLIVPVATGKLTFQTTKNKENGDASYEDAEKDDNDQYGVDYVGKTGAFTYGFNLTYTDNSYTVRPGVGGSTSTKGDSDGTQQAKLELMLKGDLGMFGFESEFAYADISTDVAVNDDYDLFGAYINGFAKLGKTTVGLAFVYGSTDDSSATTEAGFEYGDDFDTTFIVDEVDGFGLGNGDLVGFTTFKLYADYAHTDALTVGGAFVYASSNWDNTILQDTDFYEVDAYVSYQINKALNYTVKAAYAEMSDIIDSSTLDKYDSEALYYASHTLSVAF
jgi:hypothetical protein